MSLETLRKWLGAYMIFGSLTGLYACWGFCIRALHNPIKLWGGFAFGILFVLVGFVGFSLLKNSRYTILAMVLQLPQVADFSLGYKYIFTAGSSIKIGYQVPELLLMVEPLNSEFALGKNMTQEFFYVNIIPLAVVLLLNQLLLSSQKALNTNQ